MLEQGMAAAELHLLDQTRSHESAADVPGWEKEGAGSKGLFDDNLAKNEFQGWDGQVRLWFYLDRSCYIN